MNTTSNKRKTRSVPAQAGSDSLLSQSTGYQATEATHIFKKAKSHATGDVNDATDRTSSVIASNNMVSNDTLNHSVVQPQMLAAPKPTKTPQTRKKQAATNSPLDPNDYAVNYDSGILVEEKYQTLIQWKDVHKLTWVQCRDLWMNPALGYMLNGKTSISIPGVQGHYARFGPRYYEAKNEEMPKRIGRRKKEVAAIPATVTGTASDLLRNNQDEHVDDEVQGDYQELEDASYTESQTSSNSKMSASRNVGSVEKKQPSSSGSPVLSQLDASDKPLPEEIYGWVPGVGHRPTIVGKGLSRETYGRSISLWDSPEPENGKSLDDAEDCADLEREADYGSDDNMFEASEFDLEVARRSRADYVPVHATVKDRDRFWANRQGSTLAIVRYMGPKGRNAFASQVIPDTNPLVLDSSSAAEYSGWVKQRLLREPSMSHVATPPGYEKDALGRFIQCISPALRPHLPTHDIVLRNPGCSVLDSKLIVWSGDDLMDLYKIAHFFDSPHVKDLVTDHLHQAFMAGEGPKVNLRFSPAFINELVLKDDLPAMNFWADMLLEGYQQLGNDPIKAYYDTWTSETRDALRARAELTTLPQDRLIASQETYCEQYHHHDCSKQGSSMFHDHDCSTQNICYKEISSNHRHQEEILEQAEWAIVLRLAPYLVRMQKQQREARAAKDNNAWAEARATIIKISEKLKKARKFGDINEFLRLGRVVNGEYVKWEGGIHHYDHGEILGMKEVLRQSAIGLVKQCNSIAGLGDTVEGEA